MSQLLLDAINGIRRVVCHRCLGVTVVALKRLKMCYPQRSVWMGVCPNCRTALRLPVPSEYERNTVWTGEETLPMSVSIREAGL